MFRLHLMTPKKMPLLVALLMFAACVHTRAQPLLPGEVTIPIALSDNVLVLAQPVAAEGGRQGHGLARMCMTDPGATGRLGTAAGSTFSACRTVASVRTGELALLVDPEGALSPDQRFLRYSRVRPGAAPAQEVLALDTGLVTPFVLPGSDQVVSSPSAVWASGYPHALEVRSAQRLVLAWPPVSPREMAVDASPEARAELARAVQQSAAEAARPSMPVAMASPGVVPMAARVAPQPPAAKTQVVVVERPVPVKVPVYVHPPVHRHVVVAPPPAPEPPPAKVVPPAYQGPLRPLPEKPGCRSALPGVPHKSLGDCR